MIEVSSHATAGDGSETSPWTGWDALPWAEHTSYRFGKGHYAYTDSPNYLLPGIQLIGESGAYLHHTGSGVAFLMDAGPTPGALWVQNVRVENLHIYGNANTTDGIYLRGVRNAIFAHLSVKDVTVAALRSIACVTNILENFRCTYHEPNMFSGFGIVPQHGIVTEGRGPDWSTTWTIINPVIEGLTGNGLWFKADSYGNTVINGTSEGHVGPDCIGALIESNYNVFINTDIEANESGKDFVVVGGSNSFTGILSDQTFIVHGSQNSLNAGSYQHVIIAPGLGGDAYNNWLINTRIGIGSGTLTDNGNQTNLIGAVHGALRNKMQPHTSSVGTLNVNAQGIVHTNALLADVFDVVIGKDATFAAPTNPTNGLTITWRAYCYAAYAVTLDPVFVSRVGRMPSFGAAKHTQFTACYSTMAGGKWEITHIADL